MKRLKSLQSNLFKKEQLDQIVGGLPFTGSNSSDTGDHECCSTGATDVPDCWDGGTLYDFDTLGPTDPSSDGCNAALNPNLGGGAGSIFKP